MTSWSFPAAAFVALVCSYGFTWLTRRFAPKLGLVDRPDGERKLQLRPVSLGGGVAVCIALVGTLCLVSLAASSGLAWKGLSLAPLLSLLSGACLMCLAGLWDDKRPMDSWTKLWLQIGCCLPFLAFGRSVEVVSFVGVQVQLGWMSTPLTLIWLVACINAFNLIDGLDGLASSLGIIMTGTLGMLALMSGNYAIAVVSFATAGALAGFLIHNFPPARIYLGDAGSCWIGFLIGALSIQSSQKTATVYLMAVPVALLAIPFFDTLMAIIRRKLKGRRIAGADREHIHHCLQDRGLSKREVLLSLTVVSLLLALAAVAAFVFHNDLIAIGACAVTLTLLVVFRLFGHREATMLIGRLRKSADYRVKPEAETSFANGPAAQKLVPLGSDSSIVSFPELRPSVAPVEEQTEKRAA